MITFIQNIKSGKISLWGSNSSYPWRMKCLKDGVRGASRMLVDNLQHRWKLIHFMDAFSLWNFTKQHTHDMHTSLLHSMLQFKTRIGAPTGYLLTANREKRHLWWCYLEEHASHVLCLLIRNTKQHPYSLLAQNVHRIVRKDSQMHSDCQTFYKCLELVKNANIMKGNKRQGLL